MDGFYRYRGESGDAVRCDRLRSPVVARDAAMRVSTRQGRHAIALGAAAAAALALLAACAYWPGLRSFPEGDDFSLLAFARILRNPLALFVHEHFALGPYFRPLTMGVWWLSAMWFGNALVPQYAINLLLHIAVALALWRLLAALTGRPLAAWLVALAFALHPIGIGTALWLADRFDLLATLFSLLALRAAVATLAQPTGLRAALTIAAVCAAILAKETGIVSALLIAVAWLWPPATAQARDHAGRDRRVRRTGAAVLVLLCVPWLAWRALRLHATPTLFGYAGLSPVELIAQGGLIWLRDFAMYLSAWGRSVGLARIVLGGALVVMALACVRSAGSARNDSMRRWGLLWGLGILGACLVLEAPYAYLWSVPFAPDAVPASIAGYARLYYFPLCGIALIVAASLPVLPAPRPLPAMAGAGACLLLALAWAVCAHDLASAYRRQSNQKRALISAAIDAVAAADLPARQCRVYLLGIDDAPSHYVLRTTSDAVVKALAADTHRIEHCLIHSEQASWSDLVGGEFVTPASALPMRPMQADGAPAEWLEAGGVQVAFLNHVPQMQARSLTGSLFLAQRDARFEDVTRTVLDGTTEVRFVCARSASQCRY
jgi:hypothetical protein